MSQLIRCSFCRNLPITHKIKSGQAARCPLCKSELRILNGASYRPTTEVQQRTMRRWALGIVTFSGAACLVTGLLFGMSSSHRSNHPIERIASNDSETAPQPITVTAPEKVVSIDRPKVKAILPVSTIVMRKPAADLARHEKAPSANTGPARKADLPRAKQEAPTATAATLADRNRASSLDHSAQEDVSRRELLRVPEVELGTDPLPNSKSAGRAPGASRELIISQVRAIIKLNGGNFDPFIEKLKTDRHDLAGLPFICGEDCKLQGEAANTLQCSSFTLRLLLDRDRNNSAGEIAVANTLLASLTYGDAITVFGKPEGIGTVQQILQSEKAPLRHAMVEYMRHLDNKASTPRLARIALFDLDPGVRDSALEILRQRPKADIVPILREGFQYPWPAVAQNACRAVLALGMNDILFDLIGMLERPDPRRPFPKAARSRFGSLCASIIIGTVCSATRP